MRLGLAFALGVAAAGAQGHGVHDALTAGDLVCELVAAPREALVASLALQPAPVAILVFEQIERSSAGVLSSLRPGRGRARVHETAQAVHLVEPVGAGVRVTTLDGCLRTHTRAGVTRCVRFDGIHRWFIVAGPLEPWLDSGDGVRTVCEPWEAP